MLQDIAILTGGQVVTEEVGLKLENVDPRPAGHGPQGGRHQGRDHDRRGCRRRRRHQGPDQPDQGRDRQHRLRLRPREAPGAPGQAVGRCGRHQGRRRHRGGAQGEEAPHRGRRVDDQGRHRGGRGPRRRRRPAAGPGGHPRALPRSSRATRPPAPASWPGPSRSRSSRSPSTPASRVASSSRRCATSRAPEGLNAATGEYEDLFKDGVIDAAKVTRSALQNAASIAALFLTTEAVIVDKPEEEGRRPCPAAGWTTSSPARVGPPGAGRHSVCLPGVMAVS